MPETIGQQLKQARTERHLTIETMAESTRIRTYYLEAMEADDFDSLPSPVQARAFLRIYTGALGLSLDDLIARQVAENGETVAVLQPKPPISVPEPAALPDVTPPETEETGIRGSVNKLTAGLKEKYNRFRQKTPASTEAYSGGNATRRDD